MSKTSKPMMTRLLLLALAMLTCSQIGCITTATQTIKASRLPLELRGQKKDKLVPINLAALRQDPVEKYVLGPKDVIGVFVPGIVPASVEESPIVEPTRSLNREYYPPGGFVQGPTLGLPLEISAEGMIQLPLIDKFKVDGLTLPGLAEKLTKIYRDKKVLKDERVQTQVNLIKPRVSRVMVIRGDSPSGVERFKTRVQSTVSDRGYSDIVDLPEYENDVLHALAITGGMPGTDAHDRIWIFRNKKNNVVRMQDDVLNGINSSTLEQLCANYDTTLLPLKVCQGQEIPFSKEDVKLNNGDIVYLEARKNEYFYTGGLLPAGQFHLPRDYDLDVLEAIAVAAGGVGEPAVGGNGSDNVVRRGAGFGNVLIPPTRAIIVRKLADGQQFRIRVDLNEATHNAKERVIVQPGDLIMVQFTPGQSATNTITNFFNFNFVPRFGTN